MSATDEPSASATSSVSSASSGAASDRVVAAVRASLWDELHPLAERFAAAGHRLFLVGGTVRDLLAGEDRPVFDLDATTTARPPEIKRLLAGWADAVWTQGERFGTIGAIKQAPDGVGEPRVFEITTHRADAYVDHSRKPEVQFSDDIEADLSRRDFTVNAMAVEVTSPSPVLVDPFDGAGDLAARVLRTPLTPAESFSDDPLRMLRAARFITRYDLDPVPELVQAVRAMGARLEIVSAERIRDELDKLLVTESPRAGLGFLVHTGLLTHAVADLAAALASHGSHGSHGTQDELIERVARAGAAPAGWSGRAPELRVVRWAAFLVDLGAEGAAQALRSLRSSGDDLTTVAGLVRRQHRWFGGSDLPDSADTPGLVDTLGTSTVEPSWTDVDVRRFVADGGDRLAESLALAAAIGRPTHQGDVDALVGAIERLATREDLTDLGPALDGAGVMAALGVGSGRSVGRALAFLQELRFLEGQLSPEAATQRLLSWWLDHAE